MQLVDVVVISTWVETWESYVRKDGAKAPAGSSSFALVAVEGDDPIVLNYGKEDLPGRGEVVTVTIDPLSARPAKIASFRVRT